MKALLTRFPLLLMLVAALASCSTPSLTKPKAAQPAAALAAAEALCQQGKFAEAMMQCIDIARRDPLTPGLTALQDRIIQRMAELRAEAAQIKADSTPKRMAIEVEGERALPDAYGLQRNITGETGSLRRPPSNMEKVLQKKVTVHLEGVNLADFIMAIGASEDINIVADNVDNTKTMTVRAENVPLAELLDYISRNMGVSFFVGESMIWATQRDQGLSSTPMETRMYRLRKGLARDEVDSDAKIKIQDAIERFVPKLQGADLLFNSKAHVLIARNTRENLSRIEELIEALDVSPPQVLIEARFISTAFNDLRELGIDWILNSPIAVTEKNVLRNGAVVKATETQINASQPDKIVGYSKFVNDAQGLNLTYQGILTDPMFQAVLHALEISGKARTLSVPKVTTVNNREATIHIGEDFLYYEDYEVVNSGSTVVNVGGINQLIQNSTLAPSGKPTKEELGITLTVTPSVGADMRSIMMHIQPKTEDFVRYEFFDVAVNNGNNGDNVNAGATNGMSVVRLPIFRKSEIETEMIVQSGETVVMGGLITSAEAKTKQGIPFLSSIPLLGHLFEHDNVTDTKENLLIFVTAHILSQRGENLVPITETVKAPGPAR